MTQDLYTEARASVYTEALNFLVNYFNQFEKEQLQSHGKLYLSDITNVLGYATFNDSISEVGYISNWETLDCLRTEIVNRFY